MIENKGRPPGLRMRRVVCLLCAAWAVSAEPTAAERLIAAGHWKQARVLVEARIRESPDDPLANFLLSQIRNAFGDRSTPLPLAEKAVALDDRTAKYHRQLAEVQGVMAQHANPLQELLLARRFRKEIDAALAIDPNDVQALRDLLEFYLLAPGMVGGDQQKAAAVASRIAEISPAEGLLARARMAEFHGRKQEAEGLLLAAVAVEPPSYSARIALARFYLDSSHRNMAAAEVQAKEAIELNPSRIDAYAVLAQVYADRCAWNELELILADSSREVPDDLAPYYRAAEALIASGRDPARAERYLRAYLAQPPEGNEPPADEAVRLLKRLRPAPGVSNSSKFL